MKQADIYVDLKGGEVSLDNLTAAEKKLIAELKSAAKKADDWSEFSNLWMAKVSEFYAGQDLTRPQIRQTAGYRIPDRARSIEPFGDRKRHGSPS